MDIDVKDIEYLFSTLYTRHNKSSFSRILLITLNILTITIISVGKPHPKYILKKMSLVKTNN